MMNFSTIVLDIPSNFVSKQPPLTANLETKSQNIIHRSVYIIFGISAIPNQTFRLFLRKSKHVIQLNSTRCHNQRYNFC